MEQVDQIIDVLNWLRDNNKINSSEHSTLKEYYSKNYDDIDAIKDELLSFNESHDSVMSKINQINNKDEISKPAINTLEPSNVNNELPKESKPEINNFALETPTDTKLEESKPEVNNLNTTEVSQNKLVQEDKPLENELVQTPVDLNKKEEISNPVNDFSNPIGLADNQITNEDLNQLKTLVSVQDLDRYIEATYSDGTVKTVLNTLGFPGNALFIKLKQKYTDINTITDMYDRITNDCPVISEVKESSGSEKGKRIALTSNPNINWDDSKEAAKINILFFVFLMGLSLGMVAMIVLNYLKR